MMSRVIKFTLLGIAVLIALLAIGFISSENSSAEELTVDAWIPAKYSHTGDTIEIYAETSYTSGVTVEAKIYYYDSSILDALNHYDLPGAGKKTIDTVTMEYREGRLYEEEYWVGEYTIPDDEEGGIYGVEVVAKDGGKTAVDDSHSRLESLVDDHVDPLKDTIITFRDGDLQDTIDDIVDELKAFNATLNEHGGIPGVTGEATDVLEWDNLIARGKGSPEMEDAANFLEALAEFLQSDEYLTLEDMGYSFRDYFFDMDKNYVREDLTTSWYDGLLYLISFDEDKEVMSYIGQLENTEGIMSAYSALQATTEYENLKDAIKDIEDGITRFYSTQEALNALIDLAYSDEAEELYQEFEDYLEDADGYDPTDSPLQDLIHWASETDDEEMGMLQDTQEYDNWVDKLDELELKEVLDALNDTIHNIEDEVEELENSSQLEAVEEEGEEFGRFTEGINEDFWDDFYPESHYTEFFDVPDAEWLDEFELDIWGNFDYDSEDGILTITITDPDEDEYPFVFDRRASRWFSEYEDFEAIPGEWRIDIEANETAEGWYEIEMWSDDDAFFEYYFAETGEELFLVQNAGLAYQAPFVQEAGETVELKFAAYDGVGPLAGEELNALVFYGDPLADPEDSSYEEDVWVLSSDSPVRILSQETLTTDSSGMATLEIDVDEPGIYTYIVEVAMASDKEHYAAAFGGFLAVEFTIELGLEQLGTIMGIPVYENPEGIGDELELDINLSKAMDADVTVGVGPLDFSGVFENVELDYEGDEEELVFSHERHKTASLEVNGPLSLIGAYAASPDEDDVEQYSLAFGILLTPDIDVDITSEEDLAPGGKHEINVEPWDGIPETTYGLVLLESWLDTNSIDTAYISSLAFAEMHGEPVDVEPWDVAEDIRSVVYGEGSTAFADIPTLLLDDKFVLLTITEVENGPVSSLAVSFTTEAELSGLGGPLTLELVTANPAVNQSIEAMVTSNSLPIEGATVRVYKDGVVVTVTTTDIHGIAEFTVELAGEYQLEASKDPYTPDEIDITVEAEGSGKTLRIDLPETRMVDGEEFTITVRQNENEEPVEGVEVKVLKNGEIEKIRVTDSEGKVTLTLEKGVYTLEAEKTGYTTAEKLITVVEADEESDGGGIPGFELFALVMALAVVVYVKKR